VKQNWVRTSLAVVLASAVLVSACAEKHSDGEEESSRLPTAPSGTTTTSTPTTPTPPTTPTTPPPPTTASVAFTQDIKPVVSGCVRCHGNFSTYPGVMSMVIAGSASSRLVVKTQPGGSMYNYLPADRATNAGLIKQWVVAGAPENR